MFKKSRAKFARKTFKTNCQGVQFAQKSFEHFTNQEDVDAKT